MTTIAVHIASYGTDEWRDLAARRAYPSACHASPDQIILHHDSAPHTTVSRARNTAAQQSQSDWLCFLDADDELDPGYISAMRYAIERARALDATKVLFTPMVSYVRQGRAARAKFWDPVPLEDANWLVIGTILHRSLFEQVGGFRDWGHPPGSNAYEDYALWAMCWKAGARIEKVHRAVYIAHVDQASRHRGADHETRVGWHREIGTALFPDRYGPDWPHAPARQRARAR